MLERVIGKPVYKFRKRLQQPAQDKRRCCSRVAGNSGLHVRKPLPRVIRRLATAFFLPTVSAFEKSGLLLPGRASER